MEHIREIVERDAKNKVGYIEAKDKDSFMTGVSVAISIIDKNMSAEIEVYKNEIKQEKADKEYYEKDIKTIVSIISKYQD